jgi:hypothetical protein
LSTRNKRSELAALANLSCANGIPLESILRQNNVQNCFHTAKTQSGHPFALTNAIMGGRTLSGASAIVLFFAWLVTDLGKTRIVTLQTPERRKDNIELAEGLSQ